LRDDQWDRIKDLFQAEKVTLGAMIDSTIVRAHQHSARCTQKNRQGDEASAVEAD
jgi:hypothetical protein